jgi:hypothetical protein
MSEEPSRRAGPQLDSDDAALRTPNAELATPYRPLSALAVAGFGLAVLFAVVIAGMGVMALRTGKPLLIGWMLVVAIAAAGLSLAGQIQVRRSEGTRAGLQLARWGWWLSLVFGLGYGAYLAATELAVRQQAREFSENWFDKLASGDKAQAFLWTLSPSQRQGDNPRDLRRIYTRYLLDSKHEKGFWPRFLEQPIVRMIEQGGADARLEYLGVEGWHYEAGGYLVEQNFRLKTPEGVYDFRLPVWGGESPNPKPDYEGRQWYVYLREPLAGQTRELTPLGTSVQALRLSAGRFVETWGRLLREGRIEEAFLMTLDPAAQRAASTQHIADLAAAVAGGASPFAGMMAALGTATASGPRMLADYPAFVQGDWVQTRDLVVADDSVRQGIQRALPDLFQPRPPGSKAYLESELRSYDSFWKIDGDQVRLFQPVQIHFGSKYYCEAVAEVMAEDPELARKLTQLLQASRDGNPATPLPSGFQPRWRLAGLELVFGFELSRQHQ